jgi:GNAT superfamily N-acetyltransferase
MDLEICTATAEDAPAIVEFNKLMALETEGRTLDPQTIRRGVETALADPAKGQYYVARLDGQVVGQTLITFEWSDWRNGDFWWFQSVYVRKDTRGRGVFKALFTHVVNLARARPDVCGVRLYMDQHNEKARATYARLGMAQTQYRLFELEF